MRIAVIADAAAYEELISDNIEGTNWLLISGVEEMINESAFDALFNMKNDAITSDYRALQIPVFINSVSKTLNEASMPDNVIRMNGWRGFIKNVKWELAGNIKSSHLSVLEHLKKQYAIQPDEPGFVSARIIAMIINEACFAEEQEVSTKEEIDVAMKLGTGYPGGPFEWLNNIGAVQVFELLSILSAHDSVYEPSALLKNMSLQ